jgi:hypothetical protein
VLHRPLTDRLLAEPTFFTVIDTYGTPTLIGSPPL